MAGKGEIALATTWQRRFAPMLIAKTPAWAKLKVLPQAPIESDESTEESKAK